MDYYRAESDSFCIVRNLDVSQFGSSLYIQTNGEVALRNAAPQNHLSDRPKQTVQWPLKMLLHKVTFQMGPSPVPIKARFILKHFATFFAFTD